MGLEKFWRGYDWVARADLAMGWIFDWRKWLWGFVPSGGGMTFLWAAIEGRSPLDVWIAAVVVMAALTVFVYFLIIILEKAKASKMRSKFLSDARPLGEASASASELSQTLMRVKPIFKYLNLVNGGKNKTEPQTQHGWYTIGEKST